MKNSSKLLKFTQKIFMLGNGFERIIFFIMSSLLVCHICACLWVFFTQFADEGTFTWLDDDTYKNMSDQDLYFTSYYFIITTFSTVGYGDLSATNNIERIFCIVIMCLGVTAFAAGTGELTNLISTYDQENSRLQEKILLLNRLYRDYCLPLNLYENAKQSIKYQYKTDLEEIIKFVETLPNDLRIEMSFFVFEKTFKQLLFFNGKSITFIAWVCPLLRPLAKSAEQHIYFEDDDVSCIYFFKNGKAGYVLPRHNNMVYVNLNEGHHFGVSCIVGSFMELGDMEFDIDNWISRRECLKRQFTIQC